MKNHGQLETKLNLSFKNKKNVENVFVHRSYLNEHKNFYLPSNEKLEFLGDSVLSLVTSLFLYQNYVWLKEGDYTEIKAAIVRTESLAYAAKLLKLGDYLLLSKVEVAIKQKKYGFGYGKSKKEAEEKAAKEALEEIK